ncbi:MAG: hypothetical protein AB7F19_03450 [Candidatus Babeliales bacterium]
MGMAFSYSIELRAYYTRANIKQILEKGMRLGLEYSSVDDTYKFANVDEAVDALMTENVYFTYAITGRLNGELFFIASHPRDCDKKEIGLSIGDFYDIDMVHYMRIFVELIHEFSIYDIAMNVE